MTKYDFWFQVCTGTLVIIFTSLCVLGLAVEGSPLWGLLTADTFVLPGFFFCAYAYWRARKRAGNLGVFFLCVAAYFVVAALGLRESPDPDSPSMTSFLISIFSFAGVAIALFILDRILVKRFGPKPAPDRHVVVTVSADSFTAPSPAWKFVIRTGRVLLFVFCLFLSRIISGPKFVEDWPRAIVFIVILLLSCVVSGLITEDTVPKFLSFLNIKLGK